MQDAIDSKSPKHPQAIPFRLNMNVRGLFLNGSVHQGVHQTDDL